MTRLWDEKVTITVLGGPWDLVSTYNWDYNPTCNRGNPYKPIQGDYK